MTANLQGGLEICYPHAAVTRQLAPAAPFSVR